MELKEIVEQIKEAVYDDDATYNQILERIMIAVQSYGKEQYNQALDDAINATDYKCFNVNGNRLDMGVILNNLKKH